MKDLPKPPKGEIGWPWYKKEGKRRKNNDLSKVSIIIPSYNSEKRIERSIRSALFQNYPNLEIILIDGGSTDNTLKIIKKYEKWIAYWLSEPDDGPYHAMNKGIDKVTGDWIYFLCDDTLLEGVLNNIFSLKKINSFDYIYGNCIYEANNNVFDGIFDIRKLCVKNISHQSIFTKTKILKKFGKFNLR
jgi:glycosyltransferase involved in cell wall biosynthesis